MPNTYLDLNALWEEMLSLDDRAEDEDNPLSEDDRSRLDALHALDGEINLEDSAREGKSPIADFDFEDAMRDLAEDCGMIDPKSTMANYIDWEAWARDCQADYVSFDFDGTTYWIHA